MKEEEKNNLDKMKTKNNTKKGKSPFYFEEISKRFTKNYLIAERIYFETSVLMRTSKFPQGLLSKSLKREENLMIKEIFNKVIESDKKLNLLLRKIDREKIKI
ncbi:MAG: hypothetical protein KKF68_03995 [Nanoarchaeota archaeon]|nr:hypothetical protein [Nanoarchaeota archaeon]